MDSEMNRFSLSGAVVAFVAMFWLFSGPALAVDQDQEVVKMAEDAIAHIQKVGKEKAYQDFSDLKGKWNKGGVYVVVLDIDGYSRFNPNNSRLTGKNFTNFADKNGKLWVKEMNQELKNNPSTWVEYHWPHPKSKKVRLKRAFAKMFNARTGSVRNSVSFL
jgi:signal transduction histidine kinase